ncbi:MAG: hypothetical protein WCD35_18700, partial [Mycobacteriales bacterium]
PQGFPGGRSWSKMTGMSATFDDLDLQKAMRAYLASIDAVAAAADDAEVLSRGDAQALAGMQLRKRLLELGWSAPASHRSRM